MRVSRFAAALGVAAAMVLGGAVSAGAVAPAPSTAGAHVSHDDDHGRDGHDGRHDDDHGRDGRYDDDHGRDGHDGRYGYHHGRHHHHHHGWFGYRHHRHDYR